MPENCNTQVATVSRRISTGRILDLENSHKKNGLELSREKDFDFAEKNGINKLGVSLFLYGYNIDEFNEDISRFNAIPNAIFTLHPELNSAITVKQIKSYMAKGFRGNIAFDEETDNMTISLIDRLVDYRYDLLKRKYADLPDFPDKYTFCGMYANPNYLNSLNNRYNYVKRRCISNGDLYNIGVKLANDKDPNALNYFVCDILKYYVADMIDKRYGKFKEDALIGMYLAQNSSLNNGSSVYKQLNPGSLKLLFPKNDLFSTLFNDSFKAFLDEEHTSLIKFGEELFNKKYLWSVCNRRFNYFRTLDRNVLSEAEQLSLYNSFKKSFKNIDEKDFISFEQFVSVWDDDKCFMAIVQGYNKSRAYSNSSSFATFGEKLAEYAKARKAEGEAVYAVAIEVFDDIIDIFKYPSEEERIEALDKVMKKYPLLNGILNYFQISSLFRIGDMFDVVYAGYFKTRHKNNKSCLTLIK